MIMRSRSPFCVLLLLFAAFALTTGCELSITDPNSATEEEALSSAEGIRTLAVGLQEIYATEAIEDAILTPGVTSRELAINTTFANLIELEQGGPNLPNSNASTSGLWSSQYRVIGTADNIIANAPNVSLPPGEESGIVATARLFKAIALGTIIQAFEQGPIATDRSENAPFASREDVLTEALALLDDALQQIDATPPSSSFTAEILAPGIDLRNTILAYQARYHLFAGNFDAAITAADAVDPQATSVLSYTNLIANPVFEATNLSESYAPRDQLGVEDIRSGDSRLAFHLNAADSLSLPNQLPIDSLQSHFATSTTPIPLYVPGEMALIRAEALLRLGRAPGEVIAEIDAVRTKTPDDDPIGLGAGLPPYNGPTSAEALEAEILRQRRAELFLLGLGLEDLRRLGPDAPDPDDSFARTRNFYPYPLQERTNNPNTPEDPTI